MIKDYKRPSTMSEALKYFGDKTIIPVVLSGGSYQTEFSEGEFTGIDLQDLEINKIIVGKDKAEIGSMTTLQELADHQGCGSALHDAIILEAGRNVRNSRSLLSHLLSCNGRSALGTVLLAQDANLIWQPDDQSVSLGDYFALRNKKEFGYFFSHLNWSALINTAFETVGRSPLDQPIVCVALTKWPSGRIRIALGGFGETPMMAFDGTDDTGIVSAVKNAFYDAEDEWASKAYRQEMAEVLAQRCLKKVIKEGPILGEV